MSDISDAVHKKSRLERERLEIVRKASILEREVLFERLREIRRSKHAVSAEIFCSIGDRCLVTNKAIWEIAKPKYVGEMNILLRPLSEAVINACYLQIAPESEVLSFSNFDKIVVFRQASKFNAINKSR
jgi:hypothetical protein